MAGAWVSSHMVSRALAEAWAPLLLLLLLLLQLRLQIIIIIQINKLILVIIIQLLIILILTRLGLGIRLRLGPGLPVRLRRTCGGLCFVCDHGKHRNAKRYNFGCNLLSSPPCPTSYTQIVPFSKHNLTTNTTELHKQSRNPHICADMAQTTF